MSWLNGENPRQMSPNGQRIICEIAAKRAGRMGSAAWSAKYDEYRALLGH